MKITNRYARMSPHTSAGTRRNARSMSRQANARAVSTAVTSAINRKDAQRLSRSAFSSRCPKRMENSAPLPMQSPRRMEVRKVISVKDEPTAASAFRPRTFPTISVSAML